MVEIDLEKIVMVNLYEVVESGYHIEHDSPAIGCWQEYGHWDSHHGLYSKEEIAKAVKKKVYVALAKRYDGSSVDYNVKIIKIMIPESELISHNGQYYRIRDKELLEIKDKK